MAGLGGSWGSHEEFLHPRDRHGRFRKKWKMAENVISAITNFLDRFNPRTFQSDGQAGQYLFNKAKPGRFGGGQGYARLHGDWDEANEHIRAGDIDESTAKFIKMMDDSAVDLPDQVILQRTMGPDAFGLTPETLNLEDGGIEDFTGRLIADRAYTAANIGSPMGHGPGKVTMTIAVPKGTKAIIPARSSNDRGVFLDRDQELRVTKVKPDGSGGWYMMAIATPRTPGETPEPIIRSPRGVGLDVNQREERVLGIQRMGNRSSKAQTDQALHEESVARGNQQVLQEQPAQLPPAQGNPPEPARPQAPGEPAPRNEPIHSESVGGASTAGKSTSEIAQAVPEAPAPVVPEAPTPAPVDLRRVVNDAGIRWPSEGQRRGQFNKAFLGVSSGKQNPEDVLRALETDIRHNQTELSKPEEPQSTRGAGRGAREHLADDIKSQEQLADLIARNYGLERRGEPPTPAPAPVAKKVTPAPEAPKPTPGAPSTKVEAPAKKVAPKAAAPATGQPTRLRPRDIKVGDTIASTNYLPGSKDNPTNPSKKVARIERAPGEGNQRFIFYDENDEPIASPAPNSFVWRRAEGGGAPEIKAPAPKKAAPAPTERISLVEAKRLTALDALRENKIEGEGDASYRNIVRNVESGEWSPSRARREARGAARYWKEQSQITKNGGRGTPQQREHAASHDLEVSHKYEKLDDELLKSESVTKTDKYRQRTPEERAKAVVVHGAAAEEANAPKPLDKMTKAELLKEAERQNLTAPKQSWTKEKIKEAILRRPGAEAPAAPAKKSIPSAPSATEGGVLHDLAKEAGIPGDAGGIITSRQLDLDQGVSEQDVAAKLRADADRLDAQVKLFPSSNDPHINRLDEEARAKSVAQLRDLAARLQAHADKSPDRVHAGPRGDVPLTNNKVRQDSFRDAWDSSGPAGQITDKSVDEVVDDIGSGRLTPAQGIERLENDVDFDTDEINDIERTLRRQDLDAKEAEGLRTDQKKLADRIKQKKDASDWLKKHFREEPVVTPKEIEVRLDPESKRALEVATPEQLKEAAKLSGRPVPEGTTKEEVINSIIKQMAKERLDEINAKKPNQAAKKVAKKAVPEPQVPSDKSKMDARLLAQGLDIDENNAWSKAIMDDVQRALDGEKLPALQKNATPAAIGRWLETRADAYKGSNAILHGNYLDTQGTPASAKYLKLEAEASERAKKILALADRLKNTRRPAAKKAAATSAEAKAVQRADELEARIANIGLNQLRDAKGYDGAIKAMENMTMPDLRAMATPLGIKGRSKDDLKQKLAERLKARNVEDPMGLQILAKGGFRDSETAPSAPEAPTPPAPVKAVKAVAKKAIAPSGSPGDVLKRLQDNDNPPSREEGHQMLAGFSKPELVKMAKSIQVPSPNAKTKDELRRQIIEGTTGRRLDSIAVRGFKEARPETASTIKDPAHMSPDELSDLEKFLGIPSGSGKSKQARLAAIEAKQEENLYGPGGKAANLDKLTPAELADMEQELGIKRISLDRGERVAAIRAKLAGQAPAATTGPKPAGGRVVSRHVPNNDGRLTPGDRLGADEPIHLPNGGVDQGLVHMDSGLGKLWQDLYMDEREPNSFVNEIARIGEGVGLPPGREGHLSLTEALDRLRDMKEQAVDTGIADRIQDTINDLDAPQVTVPEMPGVPARVMNALRELAQIPTARRTGRIGASRTDESVLNKKLALVRKINDGDVPMAQRHEVERLLEQRDLHESADGAVQMWRIMDMIFNKQRLPNGQPDPEFQALRLWLRNGTRNAEGK